MADRSWAGHDWTACMQLTYIGGTGVRYVDVGGGPPLLLIHGMGGSWESWLENLLPLAEHYRVIAVDLPGFGGSDPLPRGASFPAYLDVLAGLLDHLGIESVALGGHSLGGLVALALAGAMPFRIRCVLLVSGGGAALSDFRLAVIGLVFRAFRLAYAIPGFRRVLAQPVLARQLLALAVHDPRAVSPQLLDRMLPAAVGRGFLDAVRLASTHLRDDFDPREIAAPTLLVWGREDRILPLAAGERLADALQHAGMVVINGVGHCAMFEAPDEFNLVALDYLARHESDEEARVVARASAESWLASGRRTGAGSGRYGDGSVG